MKRILLLGTALAVALGGIVACDSAANTNVSKTANTAINTASNAAVVAANAIANAAGAVANAASSAVTTSPNDFMIAAAEDGMAEVEMSKLAAQKSQNAEVKKFAQMMVADHTKVAADLKALAAKKTVTLPTGMGSHQSAYDKTKGLTGAALDEAYVDAMIEDHEDDVAAFQRQADTSTDADVKAFAAKHLPTLKMHQERITAIQSKMSGTATNGNTAKPDANNVELRKREKQ